MKNWHIHLRPSMPSATTTDRPERATVILTLGKAAFCIGAETEYGHACHIAHCLTKALTDHDELLDARWAKAIDLARRYYFAGDRKVIGALLLLHQIHGNVPLKSDEPKPDETDEEIDAELFKACVTLNRTPPNDQH